MNKGLAITGGVLLLLSLFGFVFSVAGIATYEPNSDNILHDTETDGTVFNFDGTSSWLEVYAKGDVDCYSYSISVTDDMFEYFYPNCDAGTEITGYTYLGDVEIYDAGTYNIDQPEIAAQLGKRKALNVSKTQCDAIALGNIGCQVQIEKHLRLINYDRPVLHTVQILDRAYQETLVGSIKENLQR